MKNWIFLHITKTGGVSIVTALKDVVETPEHTSMAMLDYRDKKVFSCTRNPYDRVYSQYSFYRKPQPNTKKPPIISKDVTFKNFVMKYEHYNKNNPYYKKNIIFTPIFDLVSIDGKIVVDKLLRFEHLESDFKNFCSTELNMDVVLPHLNKNNGKKFNMGVYDNEMLKKVNEMFNNDFLHFDYKKINETEKQ